MTNFRSLIYAGIIFTAFMYLLIIATVEMGNNYNKSMDDIGSGGLFEEDNWILGTTEYDDVASMRNASVTASVTDLDKPTGSKAIFEDIINIVLLPFNLLFTVIAVIFNVPSEILYVFAMILLIEIVLVVWRVLKQGD